ncbi:MAG: flagellar protein FlgN [Agarilytica sp.]
MTLAFSAATIEAQISSDIQACETLLALLEREQTALESRDAESLAEIIELKTPQLAHLEASAKQRAIWATNSKIDKSTEGFQTLLSELNQEKIKLDWQNLGELTKQCKEHNEINGKILMRQQQVYGRLLEIMRGQTQAPNLYNAYGAATNNRASHKVDEA